MYLEPGNELKKVSFAHLGFELSIVKWSEVSAGWSHVVISGKSNVYNESRLVYAAWGRNDLGQLSCCNRDHRSTSHISLPQIVRHPIEDGIEKTLKQIICGSEYTLALSSDDRCLYACGWNEHGNLGTGDITNGSEGWRKVLVEMEKSYQSQVHLKFLAAGGAHCIVSLTDI